VLCPGQCKESDKLGAVIQDSRNQPSFPPTHTHGFKVKQAIDFLTSHLTWLPFVKSGYGTPCLPFFLLIVLVLLARLPAACMFSGHCFRLGMCFQAGQFIYCHFGGPSEQARGESEGLGFNLSLFSTPGLGWHNSVGMRKGGGGAGMRSRREPKEAGSQRVCTWAAPGHQPLHFRME
jgi:hypothetical protein